MHRGYRILSSSLLLAVGLLLVSSAPAQASFFDVFLETWSAAPPYPTATPVRFAVLDDLGAGQVHLQTLSFGLLGAGQVGAATYSTLGTGSDGNPEPSYIGPSSFFDVFLESATPAPGGGQTTVSSFFDVFLEVCLAAGPRGGLVAMNPTLPPNDPRHWVTVQYIAPSSFFDVFFEVATPEAPGQVIAYHSVVRLSDAVLAAGGHVGADPVVPQYLAPDSFFDVFLELACPASLPAGTKVFTVTTTAERITAPVPAERTTWGRLKGMYR
jgi:hypothetical protein